MSAWRKRRGVSRLAAFVLLAALVVPLLAPSPAAAVKTVGISAPTFDFNVAAGQGGSGQLYVINDGTEPIKVMVYAANQTTDPKGKITYEVPKFGSSSFTGPATWFRIQMPKDTKAIGNTPYLEMKPKERVLVKFSFEVPPGVPAGDHQVLVFFEMFDFAQGGGMLSTVSGRVGSRVRIRVQGSVVEKVSVQPFNIRGLVIGDLAPYDFVVRNDGNVDKAVKAKLEILDAGENVLQSSEVMTETVLYAHSMTEQGAPLRLQGVGIGKFTARLTTTYLREPDANGEAVPADIVKDRTMWVFPLWLVVAAVALVGGLALWLTWRSGMAAAQRKARAAERRERARAPRDGHGDGMDSDQTYRERSFVAPARDESLRQAPGLRDVEEASLSASDDEPAEAVEDPSFPRTVELWSEDEDGWT